MIAVWWHGGTWTAEGTWSLLCNGMELQKAEEEEGSSLVWSGLVWWCRWYCVLAVVGAGQAKYFDVDVLVGRVRPGTNLTGTIDGLLPLGGNPPKRQPAWSSAPSCAGISYPFWCAPLLWLVSFPVFHLTHPSITPCPLLALWRAHHHDIHSLTTSSLHSSTPGRLQRHAPLQASSSVNQAPTGPSRWSELGRPGHASICSMPCSVRGCIPCPPQLEPPTATAHQPAADWGQPGPDFIKGQAGADSPDATPSSPSLCSLHSSPVMLFCHFPPIELGTRLFEVPSVRTASG